MIASPPQPAPLLDSLLRSGFSLPNAIAQLNLSATDLLAIADHPDLHFVADLARQLNELHTLQLQHHALETLLRVCRESPNLVHARLAATAILRYNPNRTPRRTPAPRPPRPHTTHPAHRRQNTSHLRQNPATAVPQFSKCPQPRPRQLIPLQPQLHPPPLLHDSPS